MKTFEGCIDFIENEIGLQLLSWQKEFLQKMYNGEPYYYRPARGMGMTTLEKAVILLAAIKGENESEK